MLLGLMMVVIFIIPVSAAVFRVPDDSPSIQKVLSTAHAGDTVLVAPGIYYESLTMQPGVHLHGQPGAILDGSQTFSPVVRALPGIDHTAILSALSSVVVSRQDFPESGYSDDSQQCHY